MAVTFQHIFSTSHLGEIFIDVQCVQRVIAHDPMTTVESNQRHGSVFIKLPKSISNLEIHFLAKGTTAKG